MNVGTKWGTQFFLPVQSVQFNQCFYTTLRCSIWGFQVVMSIACNALCSLWQSTHATLLGAQLFHWSGMLSVSWLWRFPCIFRGMPGRSVLIRSVLKPISFYATDQELWNALCQMRIGPLHFDMIDFCPFYFTRLRHLDHANSCVLQCETFDFFFNYILTKHLFQICSETRVYDLSFKANLLWITGPR